MFLHSAAHFARGIFGKAGDAYVARRRVGHKCLVNAVFYVEDVDSDTIVAEAIKAMLKTLDPHSAYSTPAETATGRP